MERHPAKPLITAITALMTFLLLIAMPLVIQGAIMTLNSAPNRSLCGPNFAPCEKTEYYYIEDGIKMTVLQNHYDMGPGFVQIDTYGGDGEIKFEMVDGSLFNLNSLNVKTDYLGLEYLFPDFRIEYKFSFSDGNYFLIDQGIDMSLCLGIKNLSYFTYSVKLFNFPQAWGGPVQRNTHLDNINMSSVPEPSTMLLLGSGLLGLAGYGRRRMKK